MAKTTAWVFTILGILAIPPVKDWVDTLGPTMWWWLVAVLFLIVGITKLIRNYSGKRR
ncbi:MAG: hypothetical protein AABX12_03845 [Nanoarchaeota archaeon]